MPSNGWRIVILPSIGWFEIVVEVKIFFLKIFQ